MAICAKFRPVMLEQMRKNSRSLLIMALFVFLIVTFVVSFGPQSRGTTCEQVTSGDTFAARVAGRTISSSDFQFGQLLAQRMPEKFHKQQHVRETVMDKLIERELLTAMAEKLGFVVTEDEIADEIGDSKILVLGVPQPIPMKNGVYSYDAFKNYVRITLQQTPNAMMEQQRRELLAARVRNLVRSSVNVSPEEVKADFIRKNRQVNLEYIRFSGRRFEAEVAPTDQEIAEFAKKHEAELKKSYEENKFLYEKAPAQRRLREILVKVPHDADEKADKAAREKADALAEKLKRGAKNSGKDAAAFAELAKQASDDAATKGRGGALGWKARGGTNLSGEAEDKLFAAKEGAIVGPLKGSEGYVIAKVEGSREGNIPFEAAKTELAEKKLRQEQSAARAKAAAEAALAKAKEAPTSTLKTIFPPPSDTQEAAGADTGSAPRVEETGMFSMRASPEGAVVEGIGVSNAVAKAAFGLTADKPLAGPFAIGDNQFIIRLKERKDPDLADFERRKLELARDAEMAKGEHVLSDWTYAACVAAKEAKSISVNTEKLKYADEPKEQPVSYEPCSRLRMLGG
jgi:peptidyl-prolyl cis-trans isomerase D